MRRLLFVCGVLLAAAWGLGVLFLYGDEESLPSSADAVVVLAGSENNLPEGQKLMGEGIAPTLVVSQRQSGTEAGEELCKKPPKDVVCVIGGPAVAGGELQAISRIVENRSWDTILVVSPPYQQLRVNRVLGRCSDVRVVGIDVDDPWWRDAIGIPLEWVKLGVAETVRRGC
jgi:hypothetical protein